MKRFHWMLVILPLAMAAPLPKSVAVTYVANEGFLISSPSGNVLIDALFNTSFGEYAVPSDQLRAEIVGGRSPFSKIDLYLVTHAHGDHFYAPYVADFLKAHPESRFVSSREVCESLGKEYDLAGRLTAIQPELGGQAEAAIPGIPLKVYRLKHGGDVSGERIVSLIFLLMLDGLKILHIGDSSIEFNQSLYAGLGLDKEKIDILFLDYSGVSDTTRQFVRDVIRPMYIIAMHIPPEDIEVESKNFAAAYPAGIVFKTPGETRTFSKADR